MQKLKIRKVLSIIIALFIFITISLPAQATTITPYKGYRAELVKTSYLGTINSEAGRAMTIEVDFKNTGTSTWYNTGSAFVTLDVSEPYLRKSPFKHMWWRTWDCPAWLMQSVVKPGEIGTFRFAMQMPEKPGLYTENFRMAATNEAWIPGGNLSIRYNILDPNNPVMVKDEPVVADEVIVDDVSSDTGDEALDLENEEILPADDIELENSASNGDPRFNPARYPKKELEDFDALDLGLSLNTDKPEMGPDIRVGVYSTEQEVIIQGVSAGMEIRDINDRVLVRTASKTPVKSVYNFERNILDVYDSAGKLIIKTVGPVRFFSTDVEKPLEILTNKTNTQTWTEYTLFKGVLELRYTDDKFWIINELTMDDYLMGMAEASDNNPAEYLETMAVAQRTYAMYNIVNPQRHAVRNFHVVSHTGDQLYRGYSRALTQPSVVSAVENTSGLVLTYNDEIILTPYFARSEGMTRSWSAAWGGPDKPWASPVYVPFDQGRELFGHGVGLSQWGAWDMAKNRGMNFEEILRYFYTGTKIYKVY